ncbi:MAG TPA: SpoIIE family protein phosphatase [Solirubrobacteraceae bacterium]|nr:SpoIIE family protein phosphatase [Solirubrobacteraceae bacterium]
MPHESDKVALLAAAAGITDGAADMDGALRRLAELLVPGFADAAWIDVLDPGGRLRRVAARIDHPEAEKMVAWLMERGAVERAEHSPTTRALRGEGPQLAELDPELRAAMTHDAVDGEMIERSGLRSTMALPLDIGRETLGALGVGVGRSGRRYGPEELAFAELLAGRAALALANAQLVARLTATQRRLDGILGTLAEAVTVHDARGKVVFANPAAAELLGLPDVRSVLDAEPGELLDLFEMRDQTGRTVYPEELPGARVIRGERPEPLLTRSVLRATGEVRWFLTKATALRDETGATLAVNVIEDLTEERAAYESLAEVAHTLQSSLLPDALPDIPGWELAAHYRPGQSGTQVGGDFYDVFPVEGGHMVLLGDVTGKGVAAAALTALVRHTARTAARFDPRPAAVLGMVDRALMERPRPAPVTMLCGLLREDDVLLAAGGHPLPLRARAGAPTQEVGSCGVLLGALRDPGERREVAVPVERGDTLLLYTDGVTETPGDGERFGEGRLIAAVDAAPPGAGALLRAVTAELDGFERGTSLDDRAMLALRRRP